MLNCKHPYFWRFIFFPSSTIPLILICLSPVHAAVRTLVSHLAGLPSSPPSPRRSLASISLAAASHKAWRVRVTLTCARTYTLAGDFLDSGVQAWTPRPICGSASSCRWEPQRFWRSCQMSRRRRTERISMRRKTSCRLFIENLSLVLLSR